MGLWAGVLPIVAAMAGLAPTPVPLTGPSETIVPLVVRVFDAAGLSELGSEEMMQTAGRALAPAGIELRWQFCTDGNAAGCLRHHPIINIRIVPEHGGEAHGRCGYAVSDGADGFVSLSRTCVAGTLASLERRWTHLELEPLREGEVLGYILAHELAHVLLPSAPHARYGIFKRRLHSRDWRALRRDGLAFAPGEVDRLRNAAALLARAPRTGPE